MDSSERLARLQHLLAGLPGQKVTHLHVNTDTDLTNVTVRDSETGKTSVL